MKVVENILVVAGFPLGVLPNVLQHLLRWPRMYYSARSQSLPNSL
jgi:hypothetical protein